MTDETLSAKVHEAAKNLARAMNEAGHAGLGIKLEMRPHNFDEDGKGGVKTYGYIPILSITRTINLC